MKIVQAKKSMYLLHLHVNNNFPVQFVKDGRVNQHSTVRCLFRAPQWSIYMVIFTL